MSCGFISGFAKDLEDMISLKVSLGFSERTYLERAKDFDIYCEENYPYIDRLTEPVIIDWLKSGMSLSTRNLHYKVSFAKTFGLYQKSIGKDAYIISDLFAAGKSIFVPYIFSDDELHRLFHEIDSYENRKNPFEGTLLSVYFRLTYTCGLRPNEGLMLRRSEVDLDSGEIRIINTKWHKSRTVIMSEDMRSIARTYAVIRDTTYPDSEYFFPKSDGSANTAAWVGGKFRKLFAASKREEPKELLPSVRVYDLRHRFATANLSRWLDMGIDISARLPYLQTYMGHKQLASTAYYIHILPENLIKSAGIDWERMNGMIPGGELWEE